LIAASFALAARRSDHGDVFVGVIAHQFVEVFRHPPVVGRQHLRVNPVFFSGRLSFHLRILTLSVGPGKLRATRPEFSLLVNFAPASHGVPHSLSGQGLVCSAEKRGPIFTATRSIKRIETKRRLN